MRLWMLGSLMLVLTGCASQSRYNLDMSMTELSDALDGATETIEAEATTQFSPTVTSGVWFSGRSSSSGGVFANNRVVFSTRSSFDVTSDPYRSGRGVELSYTGGDDVHQFRAGVFFHPARFQEGAADGYNSPVLFGLDLGVHAIQDYDPVEFFAGIRGTTAVLGYQFDGPVKIGYETFKADSLGIIGLGLPVGMHLMAGNLSLEAVVTPTVYLHYSESALGARNDLVTWTTHTPVSLGVGYNW